MTLLVWDITNRTMALARGVACAFHPARVTCTRRERKREKESLPVVSPLMREREREREREGEKESMRRQSVWLLSIYAVTAVWHG